MAEITRDTAFADRGAVQQITLRSGIVRVESEHIAFDINGHIAAVYVFPGSTVQAGDLLMRLDAEELTEEIATLQSAIAHMNNISRLAREMFVYEVALMQLNYTAATREAAETLSEAAQNRAVSLMLEIENAELQHNQRQELRALDIADMRRNLAELQELLPQKELRAPYDGVVTYVTEVNSGSWIAAGSPAVYINHCGEVYVYYVGNHLPHQLLLAPRIVARINGREYELYHVPVTREERMAAARRGLPEQSRFNFANDRPPVGAYAAIMFYTVDIPDTLRVPINAVFFMDGIGSYAYRVQHFRDLSSELIMTPVRVGVRTNSYAQILEGLEEGDEVFVR